MQENSDAAAAAVSCAQGDTRICVGPGGCTGGQACDASGLWQVCDCGEPGAESTVVEVDDDGGTDNVSELEPQVPSDEVAEESDLAQESPSDAGIEPESLSTDSGADADAEVRPDPAIVPPVVGECLSLTNSPTQEGNIPLVANEVNNYSFRSTIEVATTVVAANSEISFDWSALTKDMIGHDVDAMADIDMLSFVVWNLNHAEMQAKLNADQLSASDVLGGGVLALYTENARTSGSIFDFSVPGSGPRDPDESEFSQMEFQTQVLTRLDPAEIDPATHTYTIMAQGGLVLGENVRMIQAFSLSAAETNTEVTITPASSSLTYEADLTSLTPVRIPTGVVNILVDWKQMQTNALGNEFEPRSIDEVVVAKYSRTPQELQAEFLDLEVDFDEMFRGVVAAGEELALTELTDDAGRRFTGISADGTWILALVCGYCANPAPWYLTLLQACSTQ